MFQIKLLQLRLEMKNNNKGPCFYRGDYITQNRVITDMEHGTCKMFEILFYRWRIFLLLQVQIGLTTRIQKKKSTGGMCFYEKQYFITIVSDATYVCLEFQNHGKRHSC